MDGVDNWGWYGTSYQDAIQAFYPKDDWDKLSEDDKTSLNFYDIAQMCIDTEEFAEYNSESQYGGCETKNV